MKGDRRAGSCWCLSGITPPPGYLLPRFTLRYPQEGPIRVAKQQGLGSADLQGWGTGKAGGGVRQLPTPGSSLLGQWEPQVHFCWVPCSSQHLQEVLSPRDCWGDP